jgi:hypothetical protein
MLDRSAVTDELRARVRAELPEIEEISDRKLRAKVVETWAPTLAASTSVRSPRSSRRAIPAGIS